VLLFLHIQGAARRSEMVFESNYKAVGKPFASKHASRAHTPREYAVHVVQPAQDQQEMAEPTAILHEPVERATVQNE
jgi:hypothetical protein